MSGKKSKFLLRFCIIFFSLWILFENLICLYEKRREVMQMKKSIDDVRRNCMFYLIHAKSVADGVESHWMLRNESCVSFLMYLIDEDLPTFCYEIFQDDEWEMIPVMVISPMNTVLVHPGQSLIFTNTLTVSSTVSIPVRIRSGGWIDVCTKYGTLNFVPIRSIPIFPGDLERFDECSKMKDLYKERHSTNPIAHE